MNAPQRSTPADPGRRKAFADLARFGGGAAACALMLGALGKQSDARPAQALRPPGALDEHDFLSACVRCGLCVRDCPYKTLKLADWGDGPAPGTPFYIARNVPCEMCDNIPCVKACPTGALDHALTDIGKAKMGVAVITSRETCLNLQGLRCDVCYRVCPAIDKAITLELSHNARTAKHAIFEPTIHPDACTGCGKCEKSCVLEQAAIKVLPIQIARGELGHHYRKGWEAGNQAGRPKFEQPVQNLPEQAVPGDIVPLRSGRDPYRQAPAQPASGAAQ